MYEKCCRASTNQRVKWQMMLSYPWLPEVPLYLGMMEDMIAGSFAQTRTPNVRCCSSNWVRGVITKPISEVRRKHGSGCIVLYFSWGLGIPKIAS
jgi:hypothetical protein